ncbi:MAG: GntR family transcriptional regulator [Spongiibacteraceae bacterium]|jgi:DNA-binding GntR family transcriptional regulator|nr:GntR family transcriptional regulator [Spongiibacteraceae bacterium]
MTEQAEKQAVGLRAEKPLRSMAATTAERLRLLILQGVLFPHEHLGQTELARRFGMSKVPVREALKQLAAEGLVRHDHNRGYFVAPLSRGEAEELYQLRRWVESELLRTARWPDAAELAALRQQVEHVCQPCEPSERAAWFEALTALRRAILELSPKRTLLREALRLWTLTDRYRALLPTDKSTAAERALVDALAARDRDALLAAYHADRDRIEAAVRGALERLPHEDRARRFDDVLSH